MSLQSVAARTLAETVAQALPGARVEDQTVHLGFGGLTVECRVLGVKPAMGRTAANCAFGLRGEALGPDVTVVSLSGYGDSEADAITTGGATWATAFGALLPGAFAGAALPEGAEARDLVVDGQPRRIVLNSLSQGFGAGTLHPARLASSLRRFGGGGWLTEKVIASGRLPLLHPGRPAVLSVFVADAATRVVEVKVDGTAWPEAGNVFADVAAAVGRDIVFHRELALLLPTGAAPPLQRERLEATLRGLQGAVAGTVREPAVWRGWTAHAGVLAPPLAPDALAALGPLPADYATFLSDVASAGAGPGYGLLPPELSAAYATGEFSPSAPLRGVVVLADGGCDNAFVLVRSGPHAGEVWFDRPGTRERGRVAGSFRTWYADWLAAAVGNHFGAVPWSPDQCVTPDLLTKWSRGGRPPLGVGAIALSSGGGALRPKGAPMAPCPACLVAAGREGLVEAVFATSPPITALQKPVTRSWWRPWA